MEFRGMWCAGSVLLHKFSAHKMDQHQTAPFYVCAFVEGFAEVKLDGASATACAGAAFDAS